MVTLLEVMITSQVTITSQEVIVNSPINEQMVEAINSIRIIIAQFSLASRKSGNTGGNHVTSQHNYTSTSYNIVLQRTYERQT